MEVTPNWNVILENLERQIKEYVSDEERGEVMIDMVRSLRDCKWEYETKTIKLRTQLNLALSLLGEMEV